MNTGLNGCLEGILCISLSWFSVVTIIVLPSRLLVRGKAGSKCCSSLEVMLAVSGVS